MAKHIGIVSVLFDKKPEGLCTARLTRALLAAGHRISLFTSDKAELRQRHPQLKTFQRATQPRDPRGLFRFMARLQGSVENNFYLWTRRIARIDLPEAALPDLFYGRAWPHASLVAAYLLAERYDRPLWLHFSDPFPPPNESLPQERFMRDLQTMVERAAIVTMTNAASVAYQQQFLRFKPGQLQVLPHVAPTTQYHFSPVDHLHYVYLGAIAPPRPARLLLQGFKQHLHHNPKARLQFVGSNARHLAPLISELGLAAVVDILPYTSTPARAIEQAAGLLVVEVNKRPAVYTPTKLIDYLLSYKPILALTPQGSPVDDLLRRSTATGLSVNEYTVNALAAGFEQLAKLKPTPKDYAQRIAGMREFSPEGVSQKFATLLEER